ncbi:hypothetical protein WA158_004474 [Blastocystis sp. Blastoise]
MDSEFDSNLFEDILLNDSPQSPDDFSTEILESFPITGSDSLYDIEFNDENLGNPIDYDFLMGEEYISAEFVDESYSSPYTELNSSKHKTQDDLFEHIVQTSLATELPPLFPNEPDYYYDPRLPEGSQFVEKKQYEAEHKEDNSNYNEQKELLVNLKNELDHLVYNKNTNMNPNKDLNLLITVHNTISELSKREDELVNSTQSDEDTIDSTSIKRVKHE